MTKRRKKWIRTAYVLFIFVVISWIGFSLVQINPDHRSSVSAVTPTPEMEVQHKVKDGKLFLVFRFKHFELSDRKTEEQAYGQGHIQLWIDGKKVAKIYKTAYVHPALAAGKHQVVVELMHNNNESYGITEKFTIHVPSANLPQKKFGE